MAEPERPGELEQPAEFEQPAESPPGEAVPEAERRQRIDRATRGAAAGVLCLEGLVVLLIPRAIAQTSTGLDATKTGLLVGLAVVLVGCGFLLRRPWGIAVGSVLQLLVLATVLLIPVLAIVVVFFLLVWWYLLRTRQQLLGSRPGWRMLVS